MQTAFEELYAFVEQVGKKCSWHKQQTIHSFCLQVLGEAKEVQEAVKDNDAEQLKEELGDLLWDTLVLMRIAKDKELFTADEVFSAVHEKMVKRNPHLFDEKVVMTQERWEQIKQEEKARNAKPEKTFIDNTQ